MRVHHLNCATLCPVGARLVYGDGGLLARSRMVCHCLLVETNEGLVLVDTGFGLGDLADPRGHLGRLFLGALAPRLDPEETAVRQVEALGFRRSDVRHLVPTHLDLDHAGGLSDFPQATVHVHAAEHAAATARATFWERERYKPAHWAHRPSWALYEARGEPWHGFPCVRELAGLPPEILLVPLFGHTRGHCAVAVDTGERWLLHAGDAYFHHDEMDPERPRCTPALATFQRVVAVDDGARRANQARLRALARERAREVEVFCAHDPVELERAQGRAA
jgi:glyoxylase-like metal-dependent hydrolase (beta-lactamase superfamily II)